MRRQLTPEDLAYIGICQAQGMAYVWGRHDVKGFGAGDSAAFGLAWSDYHYMMLCQSPRGDYSRPSIQDAYAAWRAKRSIGTPAVEVAESLRSLGLFAELYPLAPETLSAVIGTASAPEYPSDPDEDANLDARERAQDDATLASEREHASGHAAELFAELYPNGIDC